MSRRSSVLILLACLAVSLFAVIYPTYVIRPFRAQGARELLVALAVMRFRLAATVISVIAALFATVVYWRLQRRWWRRGLAVLGTAFVCLLAWVSRVNIYELMFHPDSHPSFRAASEMKLDKDEKVIAIKVAGIARAYPIRNISYHHVINDVLGSTGVVATY
jgi:hypothetical protein